MGTGCVCGQGEALSCAWKAPGGPSLHTLPCAPLAAWRRGTPPAAHMAELALLNSRTSDADPSGDPEGPGDQVLRGREPLVTALSRSGAEPRKGTGCEGGGGRWELTWSSSRATCRLGARGPGLRCSLGIASAVCGVGGRGRSPRPMC